MANHRADAKRFLDERGSGGPLAHNGLNPATIMEKPVRERIIASGWYAQYCFAVNEESLVNRVVDHVTYIGGTVGDAGGGHPSPFLCLAFKLLQLAPSKEIIRAYLDEGGEKFKYLRALALFYVRLTYQAKDVYEILEPYLEDRRKLKRKGKNGTTLTFMDEFVDKLLTGDRQCSTTLWKMPARSILEDLDKLEPRVSPLGDIEDLLESDVEEVDRNGEVREEESDYSERSPRTPSRSRSLSRERDRSYRERESGSEDERRSRSSESEREKR